ncbi:MAG TPA: CocE/NonD family hydrolase [Thermoanaerobaculia bacterium]|nr:CocE/NonD family hydrolase [Thermoanaerobaculia bacterium]
MSLALPDPGSGRQVLSEKLVVRAPDRTELRTDVYRPTRGAPFPTVLVRTPYDAADPGHLQLAGALVRRGFAVVLQNVRGRYGSEGTFSPFLHEREDGAATLGWLAGQPWCDGRVVPFGLSYSTYTAFALAAGPRQGLILPGLVALAGMATPYDFFYRGGALVLHWALPWSLLVAGDRQRSLHPKELRQRLQEALGGGPGWREWTSSRLPAEEPWREIDLVPDLPSPPPVLHAGGWGDFAIDAGLALYHRLAQVATPGSQRLIVGPWTHERILSALLAGLGVGGTVPDPADSGLAEGVLAALETWLRPGDSRRAGASVRLWRTEGNEAEGKWLSFPAWPSAARRATFHLASGGRLGEHPSDDGGADRWLHRPDDPVPTHGGRCWPMAGWSAAGPLDQTPVEERPDVRVYTSDPLPAELDTCGAPAAELWVAEPSTVAAEPVHYHAKLVDVQPDGRALFVADGVERAGASAVARQITVRIGTICHRFRAGHRVRLEVAASDHPRFAGAGREGRRTLHFGSPLSSRLHLPLGN